MTRSTVRVPFTFIWRNTEYNIIISPSQFDDTTETQIGNTITYFATRVYDVRWNARRHMRMVHRHGVPAFYFRSFYLQPNQLDKLTGTTEMSGVVPEKRFWSGRGQAETNPEIGYMTPILIKVLQPNFVADIAKDEWGNVYEAEALIDAPAYFMYNRWDILKIQDTNWVVTEEPKIVYDNKGYLDGFQLRCRALRVGIINF